MTEQMKQMAQGDVLLVRVDSLPASGTTEATPEGGRLTLAHSETGHHHAITLAVSGAASLHMVGGAEPSEPLTAYLRVAADFVELEHHKSGPHAHATLSVPRGVYEVRRAREWNPWTRSDRRVAD